MCVYAWVDGGGGGGICMHKTDPGGVGECVVGRILHGARQAEQALLIWQPFARPGRVSGSTHKPHHIRIIARSCGVAT